MNRSALEGFGLAIVAVICCAGIPLLLGGAGLTTVAGLRGRSSLVIAAGISLILVISAYAYFKHRKAHVSRFNVEILAFAGCPNLEQASINVQKALAAEEASPVIRRRDDPRRAAVM